jgi:hypothetical protein
MAANAQTMTEHMTVQATRARSGRARRPAERDRLHGGFHLAAAIAAGLFLVAAILTARYMPARG